MNVADISDSRRLHAALAQLHRWFQYYEWPNALLVNQLDILDANIRLRSGIGEGVGHEAYKARVAATPKEWKNAHFVKAATVNVLANGTLDMTAQVTYLNVGIKPKGIVRQAELNYTAKLKPAEALLPKFTEITIAQSSESETTEFKEAYTKTGLRVCCITFLHRCKRLRRMPQLTPTFSAGRFRFQLMARTLPRWKLCASG